MGTAIQALFELTSAIECFAGWDAGEIHLSLAATDSHCSGLPGPRSCWEAAGCITSTDSQELLLGCEINSLDGGSWLSRVFAQHKQADIELSWSCVQKPAEQ